MSSSNLRFFHRSGVEVDELVAATRRSWITTERGGIGDCTWTMSPFDPKTREQTIQFNNLVLVEHDKLPAWIGVIDLDPAQQSWGYGKVNLTAYSAERLLEHADTPVAKAKGTAGNIFKQILESYNADTELPILQGNIWTGGTEREETLGTSCLSEANRVALRAGNEWDITHEISDGKLKLYANWYKSLGENTNRQLFEGFNGNVEIKDPLYTLVGPIINTITGYTDASSSGTRIARTGRNMASRSKYGPYRRSIIFSGVKDETTLLASIEAKLAEYAEPLKQIELNALDVDDLYKLLRKGNIFEASLEKVGLTGDVLGFHGYVKVIAMERDDKANKVDLTVKEVRV